MSLWHLLPTWAGLLPHRQINHASYRSPLHLLTCVGVSPSRLPLACRATSRLLPYRFFRSILTNVSCGGPSTGKPSTCDVGLYRWGRPTPHVEVRGSERRTRCRISVPPSRPVTSLVRLFGPCRGVRVCGVPDIESPHGCKPKCKTHSTLSTFRPQSMRTSIISQNSKVRINTTEQQPRSWLAVWLQADGVPSPHSALLRGTCARPTSVDSTRLDSFSASELE